MNIFFCFLLSYFLLGILSALSALNANPLDSPGWTMNPNFISLTVAIIAWPLFKFFNRSPHIPIMRAFIFTLLDIVLLIAILSAYSWGCYALLNKWFDNSIIITIIGTVIIIASMPIMQPVISIVSIPIFIIIAIPLDIMFPINNK